MPRPHMPLILLPHFSPAFLAFPAHFTGVFRHAPFAFTSPQLSRSLLPACLPHISAGRSAPPAAVCSFREHFRNFSLAAQRSPQLPDSSPTLRSAPPLPAAGDLPTQKSRPPEGRRPCINAGGALLRASSVYLEAASARAATAGRVLPSSTSRKAPPPVER